ncbi:MAG: Asp-tRNA(Asn)/Glu-tRNA(Gln) amidotransferase subunit GatA [Acidimicrobiia bacterium]|nr:Asp-tRNA(Asn)/Glu-tRNA(Gln) amidotransferase subunit GatA [Acidimicrobiia bacterium]
MTPRATDIAAAVRAGGTTASEVVEAALERIEAGDDEISAFLRVTPDHARSRAREVDAAVEAGRDPGPLAGVPVGMKDVLCTEGVETTCGSRILAGWHPPYTATAVARLEAAGAVMVGKTNMDEFAMGSSNENSAFGPARNPCDTERVPGGSSGGSAAAVAAGFVPVALGSDTGGSIRQPASLCGIVGMKPTYGRVSRYGLVAFASSLDQVGPMTTNVADAALVYGAIAGPDALDATSIPDTPPDVTAELERGLEGMTFGVIEELSRGDAFEPAVIAAFERTLSAIEAAGGRVVEVSLPSAPHALSAYYLIAPAEASSNLARFDGMRYGLRVEGESAEDTNRRTREAGFGDEVKRRIMLGTYALSAGYYDAYYAKAQKVRSLVIRDFAAAYADADVLCSPTSPSVAFRLGERSHDPLAMDQSDLCTIPTNLAGHPGISVWCGDDAAGLPIGFQILAPALEEARLFRAAAGVEAELGTRAVGGGGEP